MDICFIALVNSTIGFVIIEGKLKRNEKAIKNTNAASSEMMVKASSAVFSAVLFLF